MVLSTWELASHIDHTLLKPDATVRDVEELCDQAVRFGFYGVCVNSSMVSVASWKLQGTKQVPISVVGFPLGANLPEVKAFEAAKAVEHGAREIDMVMNLGAFKGGDYELVAWDIDGVVRAAEIFPVKVILEAAMLTDDEIKKACTLCVEHGAKFVKTSTGFGPGGATVDAVRLMRKTVGPDVGVKASGGVSSRKVALSMVEAGASRIGCSASIAIVSD